MSGSGVGRQRLAGLLRGTPWPALLPERAGYESIPTTGDPELTAVLPLGDSRWIVIVGGPPEPIVVPLIADDDRVRRAVPGDGVSAALLARLPALAAAGGPDADGFTARWWAGEPPSRALERGLGVDQTNESVILGEQVIGKWLLTAMPGRHPSTGVLDQLRRSGFDGTPLPWGALEWAGPDDPEPRLLLSLVDYLPGAQDGWTWALQRIRDSVAHPSAKPLAAAATDVGHLVADFHLAMRPTAHPAAPDDPAHWRAEALGDLDRALRVTRGAAHERLRDAAPAMRAAWAGIGERPRTVLRGDGDLHIGQVLHREEPPGFWLVDFDGNPVTPAAERVRAQPAAQDVAGMAQSFSHLPLVLLRREPETDRVAALAAGQGAVAAFLAAYRSRLAAADAEDLLDPGLIPAYRLRQVCREFSYAAEHLPRWSYVPEAALPLLLQEIG